MLKKWLLFPVIFANAYMPLHAETLASGLDSLKKSQFGFTFVDAGISECDLALFAAIDIHDECFFHQFGDLSQTEQGIAAFLSDLGANDRTLVEAASFRLSQIVCEVMEASGQETAWVHLRASVPTDRYDLPRWHMDGYYYTKTDPMQLMLKFAVTLKGPSTLFYPIPSELRKTALQHMRDREYMKNFCEPHLIAAPSLGEGAYFCGGTKNNPALHSEPPIHENRLFFSITPCSENQLLELKAKVLAVYPKGQDKPRTVFYNLEKAPCEGTFKGHWSICRCL